MKTKRVLSLFAVVCILAGTLSLGTFSVSAAWDGTAADTEWAGTGTAADPYQITSAEELAGLAYASVGNTYSGVHFKLLNNIDLAGHKWKPIGSAGSKFKGTFNGNGKIITNLYILAKDGETVALNDSAGLFGVIEDATIKNLGIDTAEIVVYGGDAVGWSTKGYVGTLVGISYKSGSGSTIENCFARNIDMNTIGKNCTVHYAGVAAGGLIGAAGGTAISN